MLNVGVLAKFSNESKQRLSEEVKDCCFTFLDGAAEDNAIKDFTVVIGEPTQAQLKNASNLELLQLTWAGADKYCGAGDFLLANASGAFGRPISEYVVGAILCLYKRFPQYLEHKRSRLWLDAGAERSLSDKTVLILGTGDIQFNDVRALPERGVVCRNGIAGNVGSRCAAMRSDQTAAAGAFLKGTGNGHQIAPFKIT